MTFAEHIITVLMCTLATVLTRFLPFMVFSSKKPTPKFIEYLGKALPCAVFAMLVVYCLKSVTFFSGNHGLPEIIALAATIGIHLFKRNAMLSMAVGTIVYMVLVQAVFVS